MSGNPAQIADRGALGLRRQVLRQLNHWEGASERLDDFEATASPAAWATLERYLGVTLREELKDAREQLRREAVAVRAIYKASQTRRELERVADQVTQLADRYLQTEQLVDFYVGAVRSRMNPELGAQLRACDIMAEHAVAPVLQQLGRPVPPILIYAACGRGASILRPGTRLWDGSLSRIAAVKLCWHNRLQPTALTHECGHLVAGTVGWNDEFAHALRLRLAKSDAVVAEQAAAWASEIAADAFAFASTGFAAVATLSDVVAGRSSHVFRYLELDPHPVAFVRVLLGVEMCRRFYGMGPWDELATAWQDLHPIAQAPPLVAGLITAMLPLLPRIVDLALLTSMPCFGGRRLADLVDPQRVAPAALRQLQRSAGAAAFSSSHWIWNECLRLTALSGLRYATEPEAGPAILQQQEDWMVKLGNMTTRQAA